MMFTGNVNAHVPLRSCAHIAGTHLLRELLN